MAEDEVYRPENLREGYSKAPVPFEEKMAKGEHWCPDYYDQAIPTQKGFITDFIYYTRGFETPTLSCIWTALFVLSSALKREAWYKWAPDGLFTNQYIIIIGPAGIVKKTTAVSVVGLPILRKFKLYIKDKMVYAMKAVTIIKDKTTPEALLSGILPENKEGHDIYLVDDMGNNILGVDGKAIQYKRTSEAALVVSELSTMMSKASYSDSMTPILIDLYDCHKDWEWRTQNRGLKVLKNLHTTMLAGTTVEGLRSSIPASAMGDGFLSRTIPVYVPDTKREFRHPFIPKNAPTEDELAKRLAWIASNVMGEFELTKEADEFMDKWYTEFKKFLRANPSISGAMSRMDINVYKTALLMRAQRYDETSPYITKEDLMNAIRLLDLTYSSFGFLRSQINPDEVIMWASKLEEYVKKRPHVSRITVLQSTHIKGDMMTVAMEELISKGSVEAFYDGKQVAHATNRSSETYVWTGDKNHKAYGDGEAEGPGEGQGFNYTKAVWDNPPDGQRPDGEPYFTQKVSKRGRPVGSVRPKHSPEAKGKDAEGKAPAKRGRRRKVDGEPPLGGTPSRKPKGAGEGDGGERRPDKDLHVQAKEGDKGHAREAPGPEEDSGDLAS